MTVRAPTPIQLQGKRPFHELTRTPSPMRINDEGALNAELNPANALFMGHLS
jgi:hypothetical protein